MTQEPMWRRYTRLRGPDVEADVDDEIEFHVQTRADGYVQLGMAPDAARARAAAEFGDMRRAKQLCREIGKGELRRRRRTESAGALAQDVRRAARRLLRTPAFTLVVVLTLALGIGSNVAIFGVVNGVLLRPLSYAEPERLMQLFETFPLAGGQSGTGSVSHPNFRDWRERSRSFEQLALAGWPSSLTLQGAGEPERLSAVPVGANLFTLLGVGAIVGRGFVAGEDAAGAAPVVVLSESFWRRRFGADPAVLGRTLTLDDEPYTVVGVMPGRFRFPARSADTDLWTPLRVGPEQQQSRGNHSFMVLGRLKPGVTPEAAGAEMRQIAASIAAAYPQDQEGRSAKVTPLTEVVVGGVRPALLVLLGAAGLVLLIACANAASLLLARVTARRRELAVMAALGASRTRVARQFLAESLLLAGAGGALGVLLAHWGVNAIAALAGTVLPRSAEVHFDARVAAFLIAVTLLTGLAFGLVPAIQGARTDLQTGLRESGRQGGGGRGGQAFRNALVVAQVSLSLVLLVGAGLLMRTFVALLGAETGMTTENVLTMKVPLSPQKYPTGADAVQRFYDPVFELVRALPGVRDVGIISKLPLQESGFNGNFGIVGKSYPTQAEQPFAEYRVASPGYFAALGIPLVRGRGFAPQDGPNAPVALINEEAATRYFRGEDPVGRQISVGPETITIVGVVGSVRQSRLDVPPAAEVYFPHAQWDGLGGAEMSLVARTTVDPASVAKAIESAVHAVDPAQPLFGVQTMEQVVAGSIADRRLYLWLLGGFAAVALLLAVAGVYGVVSYTVAQRTPEFGIRMALGADAGRVSRLVVWQGARLTLLGLAIGVPAAFVLMRLLAGLLYGVGAADPATYAAVALVLAAAALVASYVPARRATRVHPAIALRAE